ncbi:MAG: GGDEF domain-containing protein [Rubrivivax sp.]
MSDIPTVAITKSGVSLLQALSGLSERRPCLILYSGADAGLPFDLEPGRFVVGRALESDLHVDSPGVSRRHCELRVDDDSVTLADLGSVNGTFVNESRINGAVVLANGDLVRLGVLVFRFYERQSLEAALHDRIYRTATVDNGTEVFNRRYLFDTLKREMRLARQHERALAVICYDLDHFKNVNDHHGHAAGDQVLRESAALLRSCQQGAGVLGRLGGEEFALLLPNCSLQRALELAERGRRVIEEHEFVVSGPGAPRVLHRQTLSAGIAMLAPEMQEPTDLLAAADNKLYASKHAGRNRVTA